VKERRHGHHPVGELGQQEIRQREMAEVIGTDLAFEAVDGPRLRRGHDAGVVDQHVDGVDRVREFPHRGQVLQVESAHLDLAGHLPGGGLTFLGVADRQDDVAANPGQFAGRHRAQATVRAGDDHGASGE
jgi:hypothetical protein